MITYVFWISLTTILYVYFGYPLLIALIARFRSKKVQKADIFPTISLIITVYNGEDIIRTKIENVLSIEYPQEKLQVMVASDCSTDDTDEIVAEYRDRNVELVRLTRRGGKTAAQNMAISRTSGGIIVFTDSYALVNKKSLKKIMRNFNDPSVGCVTSEDRNSSSSAAGGEGLYVKFGTLLRRLESQVDSLVGASGSFYAVRRSIATKLSPGLCRDFASSLLAKKNGLRTINEPEAWNYVETVDSVAQEFHRKVRTVVRGLDVLFSMKELLNPFKYGFYSLQLLSCKLLKWLVPFFGIAVIVASVVLWRLLLCRILITLSLVLCLIAIIEIAVEHRGIRRRWLAIPAYLVTGVFAVLLGWLVYLSGSSEVYWEPTKRSPVKVAERDVE